MKITDQIKKEIDDYKTGYVELSPGVKFSQYKTVKRIALYQNKTYLGGKFDSQGDYKYWFDIVSPRIDSEVKNIDFDRKDIILEDEHDDLRLLIANAYLRDWLRDSEEGEKLNEAVEAGVEWGNVLVKKTLDGYEQLDLTNVYIINQTAKTVDETPVIERHTLTQSDIRKKSGLWNNIEDFLKNTKTKEIKATDETKEKETETPYYEIYERNGEVSEKDLYEAMGKQGGREDRYILAKVIVGNLENDPKILYADKLSGGMTDVYREYHRGRYHGRWLREGLYEILFDIQTRANEIGNQIAKGLEWASKIIFKSGDKQRIVQNIKTDLVNGDIIDSQDLSQIDVRLQGLDQLIADWNRLMQEADKLCNSYEITRGESMPSGTPFRLGSMLNMNANKLFDFIREKLGLMFEGVIQDWVLPKLLKGLKAEKVIRLTGDEGILRRYYEMLAEGWYLQNLIALGLHTEEEAQAIKQEKLNELMKSKQAVAKLEKGFWDGFKPRVKVVITGENSRVLVDLETLYSFIQLEQDPVRRQALIEKAMKLKGIDVAGLPKLEKAQLQPIPAMIRERINK